MRLDPGIADQGEHVARRAARGIVIDDHIHHATSGLGLTRPQLPDLAQLRDQRQLVEALERQARENAKCGLEIARRQTKAASF